MKCEICKCRLLSDCQFINGKYYHNKCIEKIIEENQLLKSKIDKTTNYYYKKLVECVKKNKLMPDESVMMFNLLEGNR